MRSMQGYNKERLVLGVSKALGAALRAACGRARGLRPRHCGCVLGLVVFGELLSLILGSVVYCRFGAAGLFHEMSLRRHALARSYSKAYQCPGPCVRQVCLLVRDRSGYASRLSSQILMLPTRGQPIWTPNSHKTSNHLIDLYISSFGSILVRGNTDLGG